MPGLISSGIVFLKKIINNKMLMVDCTKNLYEILNVPLNAPTDEIKAAYKKLVRIYHPDINKSKDAEIKFKLLNNAYNVLSDDIKRKNYDSLLKLTKTAEEEIFPDENSIIKEVKITPKEAEEGTYRTVNILNTQICPKCMGRKFINGIKCAFCLGEGEKKELKKIEVEIKKNIRNDEFIYVDKINSSALYDKKLFLKVIIEPPQKMYFEGDDIVVYVKVPLYDAVLGVQKEINIENKGLINVVIPPLTKPNTKIKLDFEDENINYYATIDVIFPETISNEEKNLYDRIRQINSI